MLNRLIKSSLVQSALAVSALALPSAAQANVPVSVDLELLEMHFGEGDDHFVFDGVITAGGGPNLFILRGEGGSDVGPRLDEVEAMALYGRDLAGAATLMVGVRRDFRGGTDLNHGVIGVEGDLAPWLAAEKLVFLSEDGDLTGGALFIGSFGMTESLTLEPRLALSWSAQDIAAEDTASGFTDVEISARLRKQVLDNVDVYIGATHERLLGGTRDIAIAAGDRGDVTMLVIGGGLSF